MTSPRSQIELFKNDDCVFVDGRFLVRNTPGRILWKLLQEHAATGRTRFNDHELQRDPALRLPPVKNNLETRLSLLRSRLEERCEWIRVVPVARGQFELKLTRPLQLIEREHA
jgi:adenylate cyclase